MGSKDPDNTAATKKSCSEYYLFSGKESHTFLSLPVPVRNLFDLLNKKLSTVRFSIRNHTQKVEPAW